MSGKKANQVSTEVYLRSVGLPEKTKTYTPITHGDIIDKLEAELNNANFVVENVDYTHTHYGEIAEGKVYIRSTKDEDMGMMFSWINSYNKMVKFSCGVGAFIYENKTSFFGTEGLSWIRMHTGTANAEAFNIIEQIVDHAHYHFDKIIAEKNRMKAQPVTIESYGRVMGALYFEHEMLKTLQVSSIDREFKDKKSVITDKNNLWGLYKVLMFGIDGTDIKNWQQSQQKLHHLIMAEYALSVEDMEALAEVLVAPFKADIDLPLSELSESESTEEFEWNTEDSTNEDKPNIEITEEVTDVTAEIMEDAQSAFSENINVETLVRNIEEDDRQSWAEDVLANPTNEDVGPPEMYIQETYSVTSESKDADKEFKDNAVDAGYSLELVEFYMGDHYDGNLSVSDNMEAFIAWGPKISKVKDTAVDLSDAVETYTVDEIPAVMEMVQEKIDEAAVNIEMITENAQENLELKFDAPIDVNEPVEIILPNTIDDLEYALLVPVNNEESTEEDPFDVGDEDFLKVTEQKNLEVSKEILEQAKVIEEKMAILYGSVQPYQVINTPTQVNVILDGTEECFFMPII